MPRFVRYVSTFGSLQRGKRFLIMSAFCLPTWISVWGEYMFQGGFSLLRWAQSPGAQTRASATVTDARDIRRQLGFASPTPTRINTPRRPNSDEEPRVQGLLYTGADGKKT